MAIDLRLLEQVLPLAAAALAHRQARLRDPGELLVPVAVVEYLESMGDERWYDRAMFPGIVEYAALTAGPVAALTALQAWVLRSAWVHLGDWWGQEHAGWHQPDESKRKGAGRDHELSARQLLDMDAATLGAWWVGEDRLWLERWRTHGSRDPQTLERAGLGAAELALLQAQGETNGYELSR